MVLEVGGFCCSLVLSLLCCLILCQPHIQSAIEIYLFIFHTSVNTSYPCTVKGGLYLLVGDGLLRS